MLNQRHKFKNGQLRLRSWNYSWDGCYFITIKTKDRRSFFGEIADGKMILNESGKLAHELWEEIPKQFNFIHLGEFVVMPDHIHGILILQHPDSYYLKDSGIAIHRDQKENLSEIKKGGITGINNPMTQDTISKVIRWYKGRCSYEVRKTGIPLEWQSRFYDHIIRNQQAFSRISQYIIDNPKQGKDTSWSR
ncbi:MAG: hypothetical protein HYZ43_14075 [Flavobacteriia bacterium]|nr:hypothetical protein [Flavobacteriia bacterium]